MRRETSASIASFSCICVNAEVSSVSECISNVSDVKPAFPRAWREIASEMRSLLA